MNVVTIQVNGLGLARFSAEHSDLTITGDQVTLTCKVRDTQQHPVIIDPRTSELLGARFSDIAGHPTTLGNLSQATYDSRSDTTFEGNIP